MVGLHYAITPNVKATLTHPSWLLERARKAFNSNGQVTDLNEFYQGVTLRLTVDDASIAKGAPAPSFAIARHHE